MPNENNEKSTFDEWALVELFGHQRIVGRVTEQSIAGGAFLRVDVPDEKGKTKFTRFYGNAAIYAMSPIGRELALQLASKQSVEPVSRFELPQLADKMVAAPVTRTEAAAVFDKDDYSDF